MKVYDYNKNNEYDQWDDTTSTWSRSTPHAMTLGEPYRERLTAEKHGRWIGRIWLGRKWIVWDECTCWQGEEDCTVRVKVPTTEQELYNLCLPIAVEEAIKKSFDFPEPTETEDGEV